MKHPKRKGWIKWRVDNRLGRWGTGEECPTTHVMEALALSERVVRRWLADPYFIKAGVARRQTWIDTKKKVRKMNWMWNVEKTRLWVHAIMRREPEALKAMGIPADYYPRSGENP